MSRGRRKTHAEHVAEIAAKNPNVEVLGEIISVNKKVPCRCKVCGHEWNVAPYSLKAGCGCPECGKIKRANKRRLTHDEQVEAINKVNPDVEVLGEIKGNRVKVLCRCKVCSHEWDARPDQLKCGVGCPECAKIKIGNACRLTHAEHVADIKKVNPDVEVLEEIKNVNLKVLCRCLVCSHEWSVKPNSLKNGHGCPECGRIKKGNAKRLTHEEHTEAIAKINPNIEILGKIKNVDIKVLCRCKICHHEWPVKPTSLKDGHGCPECAKVRAANKMRLPHAEHIAAINKVNPNIEILEEIKDNKTKVLCRCKICNYEWKAIPHTLKKGYGCAKCAGNIKLTHAEQVAAIKKVNPDVEVSGEIKNNYTKILCRCLVCGHEWGASPHTLKKGVGCPRCANSGFLRHDAGKLYIMVDDLELPTMMKIGVSVQEDRRSKEVLQSAHRAGVSIPALHVAKTWEGPTELMIRIEQMMHENYAEWNIKFPAKFDGCTEFFYYTPETAEAFDIIEETYRELINANKAA